MKLKELREKYKGYHILEMGYPDSIPFTELPIKTYGLVGKSYEKATEDLEVKGFKVYEEPYTDINITHLILGGKKRPNTTYKGSVEVYLVSDKKRW